MGETNEINQVESNIALQAYRSVLGQFAYASGPLTSGKLAYDVFTAEGVKGRGDLGEDTFMELIMVPNKKALTKLAEKIRTYTKLPVVDPGVPNIPDWEGNQYQWLDMWGRFVLGQVDEIYMADDWEYSTGAIMEASRGYLVKLPEDDRKEVIETLSDRGNKDFEFMLTGSDRSTPMEVFNSNGDVLNVNYASELVLGGVGQVRDWGFEVNRLERAYEDFKEISSKFQNL